jgi:hypothetical protein
MVEEQDTPWFTVEWMDQLASMPPQLRRPISYGDLATLMTMFQSVEDIRTHLAAVAAGDRSFIPSGLPTEIAGAVSKIAEINEWALLNVAADPEAELPTGREASDVLQRAWDPEQGTFQFWDR